MKVEYVRYTNNIFSYATIEHDLPAYARGIPIFLLVLARDFKDRSRLL